MGSYDLLDVFLLLGIAQGLFLALTIPIVHRKNVAANRILTLQLLLACATLSTRAILHKTTEIWVIQRLAPIECFIFLFGPLGYIYLKRLMEQGQSKFLLSWYHYIPSICYFIFLLSLSSYSTQEFYQKLVARDFAFVFFVAEMTALIYNIGYWYFSVRFFRKIVQNKNDQLSFRQSALVFVRILLITTGVVMLAWVVSFLSSHVFRYYISVVNYDLVWTTIPLLIYVIGFFALKQPELFRVHLKEKSKPQVRELMNQQHINSLKDALNKLMNEDKVYLDNELTLVHLSKKLNTSTNKLSWLLNTVYNSTFYDFINTYRVKAFISKLEQDEHKIKTLLSLSMEVGFNSKSTFNKAFKSVHNETPSSYIKRLAG